MAQTAAQIGIGVGLITIGALAGGVLAAPLIGLGAAGVLGGLSQLIAPKPSLAGAVGGRGSRVDIQGTVPPERIVYGRQAIAGVPVFFTSASDQIHNQPDREYLLVMNLLTRGRVLDGLEGIWVKGKFVPLVPNTHATSYFPSFGLTPPPGNKYEKFIHVHFEPGDGSTGPWTWLINRSAGQWTERHRLTGCSWVGVTYLFDPNLWAQQPPMGEDFLFQVRGFQCFDPRSGVTRWTPNAALCWRDLLVERHGPRGGIDPQLIDSGHLIAAANVCDEKLIKRDGNLVSRYECHLTADATEDVETVEQQVLASMGGTRVKVGASYLVYAAAPRAPVADLSWDDLAGALTIEPRREQQSLYNTSHALFVDRDHAFAEAQSPPLAPLRYLTEDQGQQLVHEVELRAVAFSEQAQRLVKIDLEQHRRQITLSGLFKTNALPLKPMSVVTYTDPRLGWDRKRFIIAAWEYHAPGFADQPGVHMDLAEWDDTTLAWSASEEVYNAAVGPPLPEAPLSAIRPLLLDIPAANMTDALQHDFGFYAGYRATDSGLPTAPARLYRADTATSEFQPVAYLPRPAVAGGLLRAPGVGTVGVPNTNDTFDVLLDRDWPLQTVTAVDLAGGANMCYLGSEGVGGLGEILQFGRAAQTGPRAWRLADLRRGLLHSESNRQHAVGDTFVMLSPTSVTRVSDEATLYEVPRYYTVAYLNRVPARGTPPVSFTNAATSRLPVPPTGAEMTRDTDGNLHIAWLGRVRGLFGYLDPAPLSETKLTYYLEVELRPPFAFVRWQYVVDVECWIYPVEQQLNDWGHLVDHLEFRICQQDDGIGKGPFANFSLDIRGSMTRAA